MIEITWLGHATFQLRLESGEVILMDPWVEGNPKFPAGHQFQRVDALLISHPHQDHIHGCIELSKKFKPKVIALFETALWLGSKGVENLSGMGKGGTQEVVAGVKATMTLALLCRRHQCILRYAAHRETLSSRAGLASHRRFLHHGPARSRAGLPAAQCEKGDSDALRNLPRPHRHAGSSGRPAKGFPHHRGLDAPSR